MSFSKIATGLQHIGIPTNNLNETINFYVSLGFEVAHRTANGDEQVAFLRLGDLTIETYQNFKAAHMNGAVDHIAINVTDVDEARRIADAMKLEGENIVRAEFGQAYHNFPNAMQVADGLWFIEAKGHTKGNSIAILEHDGLFYMFHGDVTYCDAALKANKLSIIFEDQAAARETLDRVREFISNNPTVYLSTHCPEGYENLEMKRIMKL
jgi:catechol 2,3-dioxygenase-like lactoylglutathione lyase family enzyme